MESERLKATLPPGDDGDGGDDDGGGDDGGDGGDGDGGDGGDDGDGGGDDGGDAVQHCFNLFSNYFFREHSDTNECLYVEWTRRFHHPSCPVVVWWGVV